MTDPRSDFTDLFCAPRALIGMLHAGALPGTAHARDHLDAIVERALAAVSLPDAASGPKKWLRAATGLFATGKKVEQPIPLSEFAKRQRTGAGAPRDALSAGERTRVLRMLRDEGGRLADEDSVSYTHLTLPTSDLV